MAEKNDRNRNGAARSNKTNTDRVDTGEALGTVGGGITGAVAGSLLGPIGTVAGGIAGATLGNQVGEGVGGANNNAKNARGVGGNGSGMNRNEQNK